LGNQSFIAFPTLFSDYPLCYKNIFVEIQLLIENPYHLGQSNIVNTNNAGHNIRGKNSN